MNSTDTERRDVSSNRTHASIHSTLVLLLLQDQEPRTSSQLQLPFGGNALYSTVTARLTKPALARPCTVSADEIERHTVAFLRALA